MLIYNIAPCLEYLIQKVKNCWQRGRGAVLKILLFMVWKFASLKWEYCYPFTYNNNNCYVNNYCVNNSLFYEFSFFGTNPYSETVQKEWINVRLVQGLLQRLEEETKMTSYIVTQKLPREIEQKQKEVDILSTVATEPVLTRSNLDLLQAKVMHSWVVLGLHRSSIQVNTSILHPPS